MLIAIVLTVGLGLWIDTQFAWGAIPVSLWVWLLYGFILKISNPTDRFDLLRCLVLATGGELVLSELLLVYEYRTGFLPLYVPPGHCLLYFMGTRLVGMSGKSFARWLPLIALIPLGAYQLAKGPDAIGLLCSAALLGMIVFGKNRALYAWMALITLSMEIWGTHLGVWSWKATIGGWTCANPPLGVGILYCMLDFLVLATRSMLSPSSGVEASAEVEVTD